MKYFARDPRNINTYGAHEIKVTWRARLHFPYSIRNGTVVWFAAVREVIILCPTLHKC
jgi:hypothetical protein